MFLGNNHLLLLNIKTIDYEKRNVILTHYFW
jgi:hypothetical protein